MPIKTGQDYQNTGTFIAEHAPLAYPAATPPNPIPAGAFPVGPDFFTQKTKAELQKIIDTTWDMRKKLDFSATNANAATAAKAYIEQASSGSTTTLTVRWGLHQHDNRPAGAQGMAKHFTMTAAPADWHLYVNTDGSRIAFMSQSAIPADMVTIKKY